MLSVSFTCVVIQMSILKNYYVRTALKLIAANALPQELFDHKIKINRSKELFKSYVENDISRSEIFSLLLTLLDQRLSNEQYC